MLVNKDFLIWLLIGDENVLVTQRPCLHCEGVGSKNAVVAISSKNGFTLNAPSASTLHSRSLTMKMLWMSKNVHVFLWDVIISPDPYFNGGLGKSPPKLVSG